MWGISSERAGVASYVFDNEIYYFRLPCLPEINASHAKLSLYLEEFVISCFSCIFE